MPNQPIRAKPQPHWHPKSKKQKSIAKNPTIQIQKTKIHSKNQNPNTIKVGIHPKPHRNPPKIKTHSPLLWFCDPPRQNPRCEAATQLATHDLTTTHLTTTHLHAAKPTTQLKPPYPHRHLTHAGAHTIKYPPPWAKERCDEREEFGLDCCGKRESRRLRSDTEERKIAEIWNKK